MPTRTVESGNRLKASSFASVWSNARLVGFSVRVVVHSVLSYDWRGGGMTGVGEDEMC
jgi:hypothetical protein